MLVNVITRYPAPPPEFLAAVVIENAQQFGLHAVTIVGRSLRCSVTANQQGFGASRVHFPPTELAATRLDNSALFGGQAIAPIVHSTYSLELVLVDNTNAFGSHAVRHARAVLAAATVVNSNQYGEPNVAGPQKHFSYANPLGMGNRITEITVTSSGGTTFYTPMWLVNGDTTESLFWGFGPITITFDLGVAKVIRQARWIQSTSTIHDGLFRWQGSNDGLSYADIGPAFNLGGAPVTVHNSLNTNGTSYRYYRLVPTEGASISGEPYLRETEFYIEGSVDDPPA